MSHVHSQQSARARRLKSDSHSPVKTRKSGRKGRSSPGSGSGRKSALAVELSITVDVGQDKDSRRIRLAVPVAPRRGTKKEAQEDRWRQVAAKRVSAGCRPENLARLLASIAHAQRLAILRELLAGEATHKTLAKVTKLNAGPLYYHIRELRAAGLVGPKVRDLYILTRRGRRVILATLAIERMAR